MESVTFYLKYRPSKVKELDLVDVRESLEKVLYSGKIPHAFLFSGPKGTGKTSTARILAKAVNCLKNRKNGKKSDFEPCNKCEICQEINDGRALDLIEVDAASNRGIDDIRSLREKIKLSPAKCDYKVYIIDEVHMLTTEAFNALLKTLEEPPKHALFVLCTTEPEKLPKTIISRCTQIKFKKANQEEILRSLKRVVKGEGLNPEKEVLEGIAKSADGSFRDAQKVLDQLSSSGKKISLKETNKLLGRIEELKPDKLLLFLSEKKGKESLLEIDRVVTFGIDLNFYLQTILEKLRLILLEKTGISEVESQELDEELKEAFSSLSKGNVFKLITLFSQASLEIKISPIPQLPLELVVVQWCQDQEQENDSNLENNPKREVKKTSNPDNQKQETKGTNGDTQIKKSNGVSHGLDKVVDHWDDLLVGVKPLNHSVEALLRASRPLKMEGNFLTLEVFYKFHKERLETEKCRSIVEEIASQILDAPIRLKCVLGEKKNTPNLTQTDEENNGDKSDIMDIAGKIFSGKLID